MFTPGPRQSGAKQGYIWGSIRVGSAAQVIWMVMAVCVLHHLHRRAKEARHLPVSPDSLTIAQYFKIVGSFHGLHDDGRPVIAVKVN